MGARWHALCIVANVIPCMNYAKHCKALCLHCNKLDGIYCAMVQVTYRRRTRVYYMRKRNPSTNVRNASFAATAHDATTQRGHDYNVDGTRDSIDQRGE